MSEEEHEAEKLLAYAITEDIAEWLKKWLGENDAVGHETKTDIFIVIMERLLKGMEV